MSFTWFASSLQYTKSLYTLCHKKWPVRSNAIISGSLFLAGDLLSQLFVEQRGQKQKKIDFPRAARMSAFGFFIFGPLGAKWYSYIDRRFPSTSNSHVLRKVAGDQFLFAPIEYLIFFSSMTLLETGSVQKSIDNIKANFFDTYIVDLAVWPATQVINFKLVAPQHRVLFVSTASILWNAFLSHMQHRKHHEEQQQQLQQPENIGSSQQHAPSLASSTPQ